jgi:O-succinylbenzoic acid--CoA ligase
MTETASQIATASPEAAREAPDSVGHPLMFADVAVVDETGVPREPGEIGEIVVSGPMVTTGYIDESLTDEQFTNEGLRTGDRGYRDESGRLYVLGRIDDAILTGGETVYPGEVSAVVRDHPAVEDCAVVGVDDETWGQRVAALVERTDPTLTADELDDHCRERLAGYKIPRTIAFVDRLPRTPSGTVDRSAAIERLTDASSRS